MIVKIARDFSRAPGPRYANEGKNSGELFRDTILYPKIVEAFNNNCKLTVDLDGAYGYGTAFLEESFGGLIRERHMTVETVKSILVILSTEEPELIQEINEYLEEAASYEIESAMLKYNNDHMELS